MKNVVIAFALALMPFAAHAEAIPGQKAPPFEVMDATGKMQKLADYSGKWVVLEWFNKDCPYVKKHYGSGNMQKLQAAYGAKNVQWLTVASSAKGKEGYLDSADMVKLVASNKSAAKAVLMDTAGTVGKAYGAKTTPHMFVIDPKGTIVYAGAIDNNDSSDPKVIPASKNYVAAALDAGLAGNKIEVATARPYGCGVKY